VPSKRCAIETLIQEFAQVRRHGRKEGNLMTPHRRALAFCLLALIASPGTLFGQASAPVPRVGIILNGTPETRRIYFEAFLRGMNELGYADGRNVVLDVRWVTSRPDQLPETIAALLRRNPDVIVVAGSQAVRAAKAATSTVPIVMAAVGDPVGQGLIASLARPGCNVTGVAIPSETLMSSILERMHELVPKASRIAVLTNPANSVHSIAWSQTEATARALGVGLLRFDASDLGELERALAAIERQRPDALVVGADTLFNSFRGRLVKFAASRRIPAGYFFSQAVAEGGLMSYSSSVGEHHYRSASYVHRILSGAKSHELPVEIAADFEWSINVRTAKALGITIPQSVIASADELVD
jgi:putative ABC transport system substrate-binding protein